MISLALLKEPLIESKKIHKGVIILSDVDKVIKKFPELRNYFYIIERRGWEGINPSKYADIKLVEDKSCWKEMKNKFPKSILLDLAGADFVDINSFKPIKINKNYEGIQISAWQKFKRHELFLEGVRLLPEKKFIKFGHLFYGGKDKRELRYKRKLILFSRKNVKNVFFPYGNLKNNKNLPGNPKIINRWINKSKIGIITSKVEGINRFKLECLSANIPVLVPRDSNIPLKKHINKKTGMLYDSSPKGLADAIKKIEKIYTSFSPRDYVLKNTGSKNSLEKLKKALELLAKKEGSKNIYKDIYWDGRNQSLIWEKNVISYMQNKLKKLKMEFGREK